MLKKNILYILPHIDMFNSDGERLERVRRERIMVAESRKLGYSCELCLLTAQNEMYSVNDESRAMYFPVDDDKKISEKKHTSKKLLEYINTSKPDLIIFKGINHPMIKWLILKSKVSFHFGLIVAGGLNSDLLSSASFVWLETNEQMKAINGRIKSHCYTEVLPKMVTVVPGTEHLNKLYDIVSVGRMTKSKNHESLKEFFPDYRVAIVGEGEEYDKISELARPYGEQIYLPGNLDRDNVMRIISHSKVMVHPSRKDGFPRVISEAFACAVPVIAYADIAKDGFENFVQGIKVNSSEEMINQTKSILRDEERRVEMGLNAYNYALENFSEEAVIKRMKETYSIFFSNNSKNPKRHTMKSKILFSCISSLISKISRKLFRRL